MGRPAVFLDRDGTINVEKEYLHRVEDWEWIPGAIEAIRLINRMGYLAVVVTNQAGIARGYYDEAVVHALHRQVDAWLAEQDAWIDAYYICPHHPQYGEIRNCRCRKPAPGMLQVAQRDLNIDLAQSWLVGDKLSDIEAAQSVGVTPILVETGYGMKELESLDSDIEYSADILGAVRKIKEHYRQRLSVGMVG